MFFAHFAPLRRDYCFRSWNDANVNARFPYRAALLLTVVLAVVGFASAAVPVLDHFFNDVKTYSARFEQVVLDEARQPVQRSNGRLWIERPGRFRWDYAQPYEQHIVGDGKKVWVYDVALEQVTVRPMPVALGDTPAALLAGRGRLADNFEIDQLDLPGDLQWVQLKPKKKEGGFDAIRLGFRGQHLAQIELADGFGQVTRIMLSDYRENIAIDPAKFRFEPPPGVDIIEQ